MKILFASDGSSNALEAANFISGLAVANDIEVHLIQVLANENVAMLDSVSSWAPVWSMTANQDGTQKVSQCHVDVLAMLSECCDTVSMSHPRGDACNCILAEAESRDADLIVMGARGHSMLERVLLGSVSEYVANHANCSVVIVRPGNHSTDCLPPKNILVAYDRSLGAYEAVQEMLKTAWLDSTQIDVLSVAPPDLAFYSDAELGNETPTVSELRCAGENLAGKIAREVPKTSNQVVRSTHPGDAIVQTATETESDLILIGETGRGSLGQWILGSTTKHVLRHAPCSVWVSRHHRKSKDRNRDDKASPRNVNRKVTDPMQ